MNLRLDPDSPAPLYHQIAEAVRERIDGGDLAPGEALTPMREAARRWGVNLHTVRHAYTALAREGLVESSRGPSGTRVLGRRRPAPAAQLEQRDGAALAPFLDRVLDEARRRHGLDADALAQAIAERAASGQARAVVYVIECSRWQCESHAAELMAVWDVDARPWPLGAHEEPPPGRAIATYFHYNDIRRRWPQRLRDIRFVTIGVDPDIASALDRIRAGRERLDVLVVERDEPTADNVAADVSLALLAERYRLRPTALERPDQALHDAGPDRALVFAPRVWASLTEAQREDERAVEARYVMDAQELESVGSAAGWRRRQAERSVR